MLSGLSLLLTNALVPFADLVIILEHLQNFLNLPGVSSFIEVFSINVQPKLTFANNSLEGRKHEIIKMLKSNISLRLTELERCIDEIIELETTISETFNEGVNHHLLQMLKIKFPNEISDIKEQVNYLERKQMDSHVEIRCKQGMFTVVY